MAHVKRKKKASGSKKRPAILSISKSKRSSVRTKAAGRGQVRRGGRAGTKSKPAKRKYSGR